MILFFFFLSFCSKVLFYKNALSICARIVVCFLLQSEEFQTLFYITFIKKCLKIIVKEKMISWVVLLWMDVFQDALLFWHLAGWNKDTQTA